MTTTQTPAAIQTNDAGMGALATMLAPHLMGAIEGHVATAIERVAQAAKAPVIHIHTPTGEVRKVEGTTHRSAAKLIRLVQHGLQVMLVGPTQCGKTTMANTVGEALGRNVTAISCSAGMSEAQLLGRLLPMGAGGAFVYVESPFVKAYREGGVILLDEMDSADANLLLVLNMALANGGIEIEARAASGLDTYVKRHPDTVIIGAANTYGHGADAMYVGRGALDAATLARFYPLAIDYDEALEALMGRTEVVAKVQAVRQLVRAAKIRRPVSSRMIQQCEAAVRAGYTVAEAMADLTSGWTREERTKAGLAA